MCVAANEAGVVERSVALTVHSAPAITAEPTVVVDAGGTVVLDCRAEGEPTATMEWSRKGGRRLLGDDRFSPLSNGSLRVSSAQKEDTAQYECLARNLLGSARARVTLTVRVHGGHSEWSAWGPCSASCGVGSQKKRRRWTNPLPANGGRHCAGSDTETRGCQGKPCPVDANWSEWSLWEECSRTCGHGNRTKVRTCSTGASRARARPRRSPCAACGRVQWRVTGAPGCHGARAVTPAVKVCSPEPACATALLRPSTGRSARHGRPNAGVQGDTLSCGWEVVLLGELGLLQRVMWRRDKAEDTPLRRPRPPARRQAV
ncbi:hemicentin-1-like [Pseudoliparis swirei]|uniref:hemicentin-1-like n=1 Tax=Pseudoliparis swirei TaxID=2059687 RepID=UPI0024BE88D8|nr:hemicentin-1-like [Pseudoliparis swirei]XP_056291203.1 hemicentin-1-like [Pseudoliparis swirei]XP_056291204.1 hemicentin-1-like [Pseudoliparis swirei]